jgi:hypothetical protein
MQRCTIFSKNGKINLGNGVLVYEADVWAGGADWFPKKVMQFWASKPETLRQIIHGDATKFGCGRV